ncbi:ABC transporter permease [Planctomyces sp. SH-PL62]|uniref:ABC transporter permease n=1 Tax=Planctomyces sp. SH-PL62 TaxID=1636152 RepID=UPI00078B688B|nr:ABC transporter permease [Planctomyces sp. SH-PL62]AMV40852.1 Teichoic acid translocation permease protein TagG [Planctomyces sp. SH-PL62]
MLETQPTSASPQRSSDEYAADLDAISGEGSEHEVVIKPSSGWLAVNWGEMFEYRELLVFLIWRDISARYKQTILGGAWAILQPLITMVIFTFISRLAKIPMPNDLPVPVCVFAALIPWTMFSQGMPAAAGSLISNLNMVTKVYFPRLFLPTTAAAVFLVDGLLSVGVYALMLLYYGITPAWTIVFLPFFFLLTLMASLSMGVLLAGLTLFYRDFKHIVPFLVQIMLYVTPIFYTINPTVPVKYRWFLSLNPMFGITDAFRASVLGLPIQWDCFLISTTTAIALFLFAIHYFRRSERMFADYV